jgi:NitT/TauT family transport system substrate-binding protein
LDLRIVLIFNQSLGADALLARGNIHTLRDLAGRRIGAETNAVGMLMVDTVLKAAGLAPDQVTLVPIGADGHETAWRAGELDALVTYEPIVSRVLSGGGAHRLFDSRQMPDTIFDVLVVRADSLSRHERHLKLLLRGYFQGRRLLRDNPIDASYRLTNFSVSIRKRSLPPAGKSPMSKTSGPPWRTISTATCGVFGCALRPSPWKRWSMPSVAMKSTSS